MSYKYSNYTAWLATIEAQKALLRVRDWVTFAMKTTGAFRCGNAMAAAKVNDNWEELALIHRLEELGEIYEIPGQTCTTQDRVYIGKS